MKIRGADGGCRQRVRWRRRNGRCVRHDGTRTPINLAVRAITSDAGEMTGYVSIAFDITERGRCWTM